MLKKLEKYRANLNNETAVIALLLDPRRSSSDVSAETKSLVRKILADQYGYLLTDQGEKQPEGFNLFTATSSSEDVATDEVEDFSMMTLKADKTCESQSHGGSNTMFGSKN